MRLSSQPRLDQEKGRAGEKCPCGAKNPGGNGSSVAYNTTGSSWFLSPWLIALGLFLVSLYLTTRHNGYPFYYEKDAHSKVAQVISGERNFYHPPLMLNAADIVLRLTGKPFTPENVIQAGRFCMAFFTSSAIAAFGLLGYRLAGAGAAIGIGGLLLTNHLVFDLSHHFKEDPALLFGLGLSFLAMQLFWERKTLARSACMGIAASLAVSGKYVGIAALPMALVLLFLARRELRLNHWLSFFGAYIATIAIVDYQLLMQLGEFQTGFKTEMADLTRESKRHEIPHIDTAYRTLRRFLARGFIFTMPVFIGELLLRHRHHPVRWLITLYPIIFVNILVWSPRLFTRHFLPVIALFLVWVGLTIPSYARWLVQGNEFLQKWQPRGQWHDALLRPLHHFWLSNPLLKGRSWNPSIIGAVLVCCFVLTQKGSFKHVYNTYAHPTREKLIAFINEHLPDDALILFDERAFLLDNKRQPRLDHPIRCAAITNGRLSAFTSLEEIYATGATHIVGHAIDSRALFQGKFAVKKSRKDNEQILNEILNVSEELCYIAAGLSTYIGPPLLLLKLPEQQGRPKVKQESFHLPEFKEGAQSTETGETAAEE